MSQHFQNSGCKFVVIVHEMTFQKYGNKETMGLGIWHLSD